MVGEGALIFRLLFCDSVYYLQQKKIKMKNPTYSKF